MDADRDDEKFVPAKAVRLAEEMIDHGTVVQRIPPNNIERTLTYTQLSDMIDATIAIIMRFDAEVFDGNVSQKSITPGELKAYLYAIAMYHFQSCGCLVITAGGSMPPQCEGMYVPNNFLAMLQYIGEYEDGGCIGRPRYVTPSTAPVLATEGVTSGTPVETNLSLSGAGLVAPVYTRNAAQEEYQGITATANTSSYIANWSANAARISRVLQGAGYPCTPMWGVAPRVKDGSFYTFPCDGYNEVTSTQPQATLFWVNPFREWDVEIGVLFWNADSAYTNNAIHGVLFAPRIGPIPIEWPSCAFGIGTAGTQYDEMYWIRKLMFAFILNGVKYEPGMPTEELRTYFGERLYTFRITPMAVDFRGWHENLAKAVLQLIQQGATWSTSAAFVTFFVNETAMLRKLQISTPGMAASPGTWYKNVHPRSVEQLSVIAPLAQLISELGPVVYDGQLHCPNYIETVASDDAWYTRWRTFGVDVSVHAQYNQCLIKVSGASDPTFTWGSIPTVLSAAWATAYLAITNPLNASWIAVFTAHREFQKFISGGALYGKGEFTFSVSYAPRGGQTMFVRNWTSGSTAAPANYVKDPSDNACTLTTFPLMGLYTQLPLTGPDIALAAICRWVTGYQAAGATSVDVVNTHKFGRQWNFEGQNSFIDRFMAEALGPGGAVIDQLSEAMRKRHENMSSFDGISSADDDVDACLFDSLKGVIGTLAGTLQPHVSRAAGIGCGMIPAVGQFMKPVCKETARVLMDHVADNARVSTNRHASVSYAREFEAFGRQVKKHKPVEKGELTQDRAGFYASLQKKKKRIKKDMKRLEKGKAPKGKKGKQQKQQKKQNGKQKPGGVKPKGGEKPKVKKRETSYYK